DTVRDSLLVVEEDLRVKSANRSFYQTFKLSPRDVEGRFIHAMGGGQWNLPELRALLENTFRSSKVKDDVEAEAEFAGLGRRLLRFTARRLYREDLSGKKRVVLAIDDVTVRRELEELESLRKRDEMRREFVANVSHQFHTPLAVIQACAETLKGRGLADAQRLDFVETVERHAARLSRLVADLMALSALEGGRNHSHRQRIALGPFARDYARSLAPLLGKRRLALRVKVRRGVAVRAEKLFLQQVFQNLCENAIKYSDPGGRIEIKVGARHGNALVSIRDSGIGISRKELELIFEPFHRTPRGRAFERAGTGLGLSIARKIVESFGGRIWAESRIGAGSTFSFTLPLA
ncbi:MAG: hypothetical protein KGK30_03830, partial [Elusimicrobia bacterium]|nr:hypothetical protein [Elusimicrobiota bacterium]